VNRQSSSPKATAENERDFERIQQTQPEEFVRLLKRKKLIE